MTTKEKFIDRYNGVRDDIIKALDDALEKAIGNGVVDLEKCVDDYRDVYSLIGAVLQREYRFVMEGSTNSRMMKRQARLYLRNYRVWMRYAGDYLCRSHKS